MKNKAKKPKLENPKGRGFGVRKYEKLLPPCDTLDEQRRKLRRFPSYGTDELLAASRARLAQNSTLDDVIALVRSERMSSQLTELMKDLGLNPAARDCWRDGFIKLAKLHHNVDRLIHRWSEQYNPAKWSFEEESSLLVEAYGLQQLGHSERKAIEIIANGELRSRRARRLSQLEIHTKSSKARFNALWRKYMRLKRERTNSPGLALERMVLGTKFESNFEIWLFMLENHGLGDALSGDNQSPKKKGPRKSPGD
jgi:hypothetical protein